MFTGPWRVSAVLPFKEGEKHASDLSPYPTELILFQPVDSTNTWYGQIYKPISARPFKKAGIKGFTPIQPFKVAKNILAQSSQYAAFHWPSLSELNDDIAPFPWADDSEYERYMAGDSISKILVLTTGPPSATPNHPIPSVLAIHLLTAAIIRSTDRLFFVSHSIGANDAREWRLARVAFNDSVSIYLSCTLDGRFLFEFYICHPANWRYNAVNQCYWIQFHGCEDILHPSLTTDTHLVRPSDTSDDYAKRHNLLPFWKWLNITHTDTYIHGPFEFATRKSRDRICQGDWDVLRQHTTMFQHPLPAFDVPTYLIHVDRGTHVTYHDQALTHAICFEALQTSINP